MEFINATIDQENFTNLSSTFETVQQFSPLNSYVPVWSKICVVVFIVLAMIIGVPGNSLVMAVLLKVRRRTSTDWFVIFIALTDIMSLLVSGPTHISAILPEIWTVVSSPTICRIHIYFSHFVCIQSAFLITCVGIDRYFKTCKPHSVFFTSRSALWTSIGLYILSAVVNVSHFFTSKLNDAGECVLDSSRTTLRLVIYGLVLTIIIVSFIILALLYSKIALQIRQSVKVEPATNIFQLENSSKTSQKVNIKTISTNVTVLRNYETQPNKTETCLTHGRTSKCSDPTNRTKTTTKNTTQEVFYKRNVHAVHETRIRVTKTAQCWRQVNKTTKIIGAITAVFFISTFFPSLALIILTSFNGIKKNNVGRIVIFFMARFYMINNFANPIFYIWLSSAFRQNARRLLTVRKRRIGIELKRSCT